MPESKFRQLSSCPSVFINMVLLEACEQYIFRQTSIRDEAIRGIKALATVRRVPVCRIPVANPNWVGRPMNLSRPQNISALFIQLSGSPSLHQCLTCSQKKGPWVECIVTSDPLLKKSTQGSCGCCYYNGCAARCSFRPSNSQGNSEHSFPNFLISF
jgi:Protein of unknown function (DUF3716)